MDRRGVKHPRFKRAAARGRVAQMSRISQFRANMRGNQAMVAPLRRSYAMDRQIKALIAAKKRDAADVTRDEAPLATTTIACLTSSTDFATAASGTGLLDMDGDECLINYVRLNGRFNNAAVLDENPLGNFDAIVRKIVVWFKKPLLVASAAGTLPPITEVLVTDQIDSMPVQSNANGGRFQILSDRQWNLGTNTHQSATTGGSAAVTPGSNRFYDYIVKVNKKVKFKSPSQSGGVGGGHYDSDVSGGQVSSGLLVLYTLISKPGPATPSDSSTTRLNYTG